MAGKDFLKFSIGEDKSLQEVLCADEVIPLFLSFLVGGIDHISIMLPDGKAYLEAGERTDWDLVIEHGLFLEGEQVGLLKVAGIKGAALCLDQSAMILRNVLITMMTNNLKRALTTDVHTQVIELSYDELLSVNRSLAASEERYRLLSAQLEEEVQARTNELKEALAHMVHQNKMAAVGQLAAGIAHEINNPIGFIRGNLRVLKKYAGNIIRAMNACRSCAWELNVKPSELDNVEKVWQDMKIDYILEDLLILVAQCLEGTDRIAGIVSNLMLFAGIHDEVDVPVDVQEALEQTLKIMANQIPADAVIERNYETVNRIMGRPSLVCQAFHCVLMNAFQARPNGLRLKLRIERVSDCIRITVDDNGPGIPEDIQDRVFEPFFTTRDVGQGQGMGLAIAYQIVDQFGGSISAGISDEGGARITMKFPLVKS